MNAVQLRRASAVLAATGTAVVLYLLGRHAMGIEIESVATQPERVTLGSVLVASSISSALGWVLLATIEGRHGRTLWTRIAVTVTVVSLLGPLTTPDLTAAGRGLLMVLHLAVGAVTIITLLRVSAPAEDLVPSSA